MLCVWKELHICLPYRYLDLQAISHEERSLFVELFCVCSKVAVVVRCFCISVLSVLTFALWCNIYMTPRFWVKLLLYQYPFLCLWNWNKLKRPNRVSRISDKMKVSFANRHVREQARTCAGLLLHNHFLSPVCLRHSRNMNRNKATKTNLRLTSKSKCSSKLLVLRAAKHTRPPSPGGFE